MAEPSDGHPNKMLYAVTIHNCIADGELQKMKQLAAEAETHLAEVSAALDKLKAEIAQAGG